MYALASFFRGVTVYKDDLRFLQGDLRKGSAKYKHVRRGGGGYYKGGVISS